METSTPPVGYLVLGGGGHASVLLDALFSLVDPARILGILDEKPDPIATQTWPVPWLGNDDVLYRYAPESVLLVNGLGSVGVTTPRRALFDLGKKLGFNFAPVIHPRAIVSSTVTLGEGVQIMAGSIIQPGVHLASDVIVNTGASIDHDCQIGAHAHIAPGAVLCGSVHVGPESHIGAGSVLVQGIHVGARSIVGAGAVVLHHVNTEARVVGVPARNLPD